MGLHTYQTGQRLRTSSIGRKATHYSVGTTRLDCAEGARRPIDDVAGAGMSVPLVKPEQVGVEDPKIHELFSPEETCACGWDLVFMHNG